MSKVLTNFQKLNRLNLWNDDTDYGTHLNIGNPDLDLSLIKRFYHSLFVPFCEWLKANPAVTEALHGRNFTYYASPINRNSDVDAHCSFVNLQHSTHIEFRLCKLVSARQYMLLARFYQDVVQKILVDYFQANFNESMKASDKRELASKASAKMIKLYKKYFAKYYREV